MQTYMVIIIFFESDPNQNSSHGPGLEQELKAILPLLYSLKFNVEFYNKNTWKWKTNRI